jgi:hypothetical protein
MDLNLNLILFDQACIYDKGETTIYGQYKTKFDSILITNTSFQLVFCSTNPNFYIKIRGRNLKSIIFIYNEQKFRLDNITLCFPFENCDLQLNSTSAIISTICKDYSHRLDEWIQYNLKLGFSGIVIFNNDGNLSNPINEPTNNCIRAQSTEEICKKYQGKVWVINFPYAPFRNEHWNNIQRASLHIGVNAFRTKCRNIALIDADEFIYMPANKNIEDFLQKHTITITMRSNILTNQGDNDVLNNNILELAKYIGEDKWPKIILHTAKVTADEFILTPHSHPSEKVMPKEDIIHYHCWMNRRYNYNKFMPQIDLLDLIKN